MSDQVIKVLLVEDNPMHVLIVKEHLAGSTEPVFVLNIVGRLAEAIQYLKTEPTDVVVLDLALPDSVGLPTFISLYQVCGRQTPIVVLTATQEQTLGNEITRLGGQDYLMKQWLGDAQAFRRCLRYACERTRRELAEREVERTRELAAANAELQRKNQQLQQLLYTVSHDLRAPLVTCQGYVGLLKDDLSRRDWEEAAVAMSRIEKAVQRMNVLLDDLLKLSRLGSQAMHWQQVDAAALVREVVEGLTLQLQVRHATIAIEQNLPRVRADRRQFFQVLENLLVNAIKHGCPRPGGRITVDGQRSNGDIRICVRDDGPGIAPEYHERIFQMFQRLTKDTEGTGMGLAIVATAMQLHGGRAWVESVPGHGATFWLAFPDRE